VGGVNDFTGHVVFGLVNELTSDGAGPFVRVDDAVLKEARLAVGPLGSGGKAYNQREL
jgi:hypothetical protein